MKILWVEDGGANLQASEVASAMFGGLFPAEFFEDYDADEEFQDELPRLFAAGCAGSQKHEIVVCRSFDDWLDVSRGEALDFDVALLDINLAEFPVSDPPIKVPDFERRAGLFIYHQLREEYGMSGDHIAFFSGEEATMLDFQQACDQAMLKQPTNLFEKKDEHYARVSRWLQGISESPYQRLRRAVLDGASYLGRQIDGVDEGSLEEGYGLFRPSNPRLWGSWDAYREQMERYFRRMREALPMSEPRDLAHHYQSLIRELTSLWQDGSGSSKILLPEEGPTTADKLFIRNSQRILSLINDWACRDLLSDETEAADTAYLALLTTRSWGPWTSCEPHDFERSLLDLLPAAVESSWLCSRLDNEMEERLSRSFKTLAEEIPGEASPAGFLSCCESLTEALDQTSDRGAHEANRSRSLALLHQAFWHAVTPASVEPLLFFKVQDLEAGSLLEEIGRRIYAKSFPQDASK